jgi:hypothetical protein
MRDAHFIRGDANWRSAEHAAPPWFERRVLDGLRFLAALPLPGVPCDGMFGVLAMAWVDTLWRADADWNESADNARLYQGFMDLAAQCARWPSPSLLLRCLRPRYVPLAA